jgi:hypothetical protein
VFNSYAVGFNVVEGVGYPKIRRLSLWLPRVASSKMLILAFKSRSIEILQDGQS